MKKDWETCGSSAWRRKGFGQTLHYPKGVSKKAREGLFTRAWSGRLRDNGFKIKEDRFRSGIRKKFFSVRP